MPRLLASIYLVLNRLQTLHWKSTEMAMPRRDKLDRRIRRQRIHHRIFVCEVARISFNAITPPSSNKSCHLPWIFEAVKQDSVSCVLKLSCRRSCQTASGNPPQPRPPSPPQAKSNTFPSPSPSTYLFQSPITLHPQTSPNTSASILRPYVATMFRNIRRLGDMSNVANVKMLPRPMLNNQ